MTREEFDRWSVGVSGIVGVEWLVASRIGIHAEYGFAYTYFDQRSKLASETREQVVDGDGHDFGGRPVLLGVSAYFQVLALPEQVVGHDPLLAVAVTP